jgi:hypothetical protein
MSKLAWGLYKSFRNIRQPLLFFWRKLSTGRLAFPTPSSTCRTEEQNFTGHTGSQRGQKFAQRGSLLCVWTHLKPWPRYFHAGVSQHKLQGSVTWCGHTTVPGAPSILCSILGLITACLARVNAATLSPRSQDDCWIRNAQSYSWQPLSLWALIINLAVILFGIFSNGPRKFILEPDFYQAVLTFTQEQSFIPQETRLEKRLLCLCQAAYQKCHHWWLRTNGPFIVLALSKGPVTE